MKSTSRVLILVGLCLLIALPMLAQTTSSLTGVVTTDGAPLPGATVTVSSPTMQGTRTTTTGDSGGYSFAGLPPGTFTVMVELQGMQSSTKKVTVGVGQTGRADADLKVSAVTEAITVTASAPTVLETPTVSQNISSELVDQLPIGRTVLAAALLAPGVNDNTLSAGQLSISGSPGYDNLVLVNGVSVTENVRHQALDLYVEDAIQETTVLTGGISAEYGGFTGGVVNSITKSGGNEFSGSFRDSLTNGAWQSRTPGQVAANTKLIDKLNSVYEGTFGGYVMKDRLWFFANGRKTKSDQQRSLRAVPTGDATRSSLDFVTGTDAKRWEIKLTGQLSARHNLSASYFDASSTQEGAVFTTTSYDLEQLSGRSDPQKLKTFFYNGVLTNNWLVEGRWNSMDWGVANGNGSQFTDFVRGTIVRNRADGSARWNSPTFCGVCDKETRSNDSYAVKSHYFLSSKNLGNHDFVAGYENFAEHRFANNYQSGSDYRLFVNSAARYNGVIYPTICPPGTACGGNAISTSAATFLVWTPIFALQQNESDLASNALFFNDRWDLNSHWAFSLGMRYDKNDATDGSGNKVSDDSKITPRLNATFDPKGDGRHRFTASYAQYASRIVDGPGTASASAGSPGYIYYLYNGPAINPAGTPTSQLVDTRAALAIVQNWFFNNCNSAGKCGPDNLSLLRPNSGHSVPGYDVQIDDTLSSPYVSEITVGYGAQWLSNVVTRVDLISRDWKDFYAFRVDSTTPQAVDPLGIGHDVSVVENSNDITRKYRGIQFQGTWAPRRFNVGLNYTYSTLKGNDTQESATSGTVGNSPQSIFYPELRNFASTAPQGYLAQDQRHRARAWVGYDVPFPHVLGNVNVSLLQNFDSGWNYSAVGTAYMEPYYDKYLPANSKYINPVDGVTYYFSKRGEFHMDDVMSTNVALNYNLPIHGFELFATGEVLNVFDNDTVTVVNTSISTAYTSGNFAAFDPAVTTPIECPQGTAGATCKAMGAHWQKGASFGAPASSTSYQTPRTYRFQVGFRF
jgi:outer membrane receptor for ferrienterochelin and colicin